MIDFFYVVLFFNTKIIHKNLNINTEMNHCGKKKKSFSFYTELSKILFNLNNCYFDRMALRAIGFRNTNALSSDIIGKQFLQ